MNKYIVKIEQIIDATNEQEARKLFWKYVDNTDYLVSPSVEILVNGKETK